VGLQIKSKIGDLQRLIPEGVAAPSGWLATQGYSRQLVRKYVQGGWLRALAHGAFARPTHPVDAEGVVLGWQRFGGGTYHVGGLSAFYRLRAAHYLPLGGEQTLELWGTGRVPAWVTAVRLSQRIVIHKTRLFNATVDSVGLEPYATKVRDWTLQVSAHERAMMEVLSLVGAGKFSFTHAAELFEGLTVLRPDVLNPLLAGCRNVAVKRLFLFLGTQYQHQWIHTLDREHIDLGKGKRSIVSGGRYDREFRITVPERFGVVEPEQPV
jgi:hypothetical protein